MVYLLCCPVLYVGPDDDENDIREEAMKDLTNVISVVETEARGVTVQASTLGWSTRALLGILGLGHRMPSFFFLAHFAKVTVVLYDQVPWRLCWIS